jgi:hypothetical protein
MLTSALTSSGRRSLDSLLESMPISRSIEELSADTHMRRVPFSGCDTNWGLEAQAVDPWDERAREPSSRLTSSSIGVAGALGMTPAASTLFLPPIATWVSKAEEW